MSIFIQPHTKEYSVVDPIQSSLDADIIKNDKLNPNLRKQILEEVNKIKNHFSVKINKIWIVGSSLTFQYTPKSDIDVTLFVDATQDNLKDLNKICNEEYNEKIYINLHPVNFHFASGKYLRFKADAIYDLYNDKWIKKPEALEEDDVEEIIKGCQNVKEFNEILEEYLKLRKLLEHYNGNLEALDEIFEQTFKVNYLFNKIKDIRREEFKKRKDPNLPSANFRCSNIIYKLLENYGLGDLSKEITEFIRSRTKF